MKRIAIFQQDLGVGGIQKSLVNLLSNLDYTKLTVDLYLFEKSSFWDERFPEGVTVKYIKKPLRVFSFLPFDFGRKIVHFDFSDVEEYDLAIDFNSYQFGCALGATTVPAKRRVMWIHNDVEIKLKNEWKYRVLWNAFKDKFKYYDEFIPVSKALEVPFRKMSGIEDKKFTSIQNYIDVDDIRKKQLENDNVPEIDGNCLNFVAVGKLCHQKAYDIMLDDFAEASKARSDIRLYIIGDGPDKDALIAQRDRLKLTDKVYFLGNRPNPFCVMDKMDAFISTSRYEGQPLNIMEAMAVGLPLFCTKNLEKYTDGLNGYDDIVSAIISAKKQPKHPDSLKNYNTCIIDSVAALAEGNDGKKHIAIFQNDFGVGGIQKSLINLLKNMDYSKTAVDLYVFQDSDFWKYSFPESVRVFYLKPAKRIYSFLPFDFGKTVNNFTFPTGKNYDLAIDFNSYQFSCAFGAITVPAKYRVMWIHNDVEIKLKNEWKYRVLWNAFKEKFKYFDEFVCVSSALVDPFVRASGMADKRYSSIQNYIDVEEIRQKQRMDTEHVAVNDTYMNFAAIGRLCHQKGYDIMLDTFAEALRSRNDLRLYIIGDGEDKEKLLARTKELVLEDSVFFLGNRKNPFCILDKMDAFVSCSRYEGQGMNIMEAAAVGLPIYYPKHLEKYVDGFRSGSENLVNDILNAQKMPKTPDNLQDYNAKIINSILELAERTK